MTKLLYFGLGLLVGGGIGTTTAYILTKRHYSKVAEDEIDEMRHHFNKKIEDLAEKTTEAISNKSEAVFESEEKKPSMEDIVARRGEKTAIMKEYKDYTKAYTYEEGPVEETGEGENIVHQDPPYLISEEQYSTENMHYEKREFRYYEDDDTLCNEEDEVLETRYSVTEEAITELLSLDDDYKAHHDEIIYVRNDMLKIDYEVQLIHGSYDEQVLGHYAED